MSRSVRPDYESLRERQARAQESIVTAPEPKHLVTVKGGRVEIKCQSCKLSMTVSGRSSLGAAMIENWPKVHKCPKDSK